MIVSSRARHSARHVLTGAKDNTDAQYSTFRSNLPYTLLLLVLHPLLRTAWNSLPWGNGLTTSKAELADARLEQRASFDYVFALIFLAALHGVSAFKVLFILWINYRLGTTLPRRWVPGATWVFNITTLFANELCQGYKLRDIATLLSPLGSRNVSAPDGFFVGLASTLDGWGGIMPRWEILFNITILRLISFNMDLYWSRGSRSSSPVEVRLVRDARRGGVG